jgi:hypothetical protein
VVSAQVSGVYLSFKTHVRDVKVILGLFIVGTPIVALALEKKTVISLWVPRYIPIGSWPKGVVSPSIFVPVLKDTAFERGQFPSLGKVIAVSQSLHFEKENRRKSRVGGQTTESPRSTLPR